MKWYLHPVAVTFFTVTVILLLPLFFTHKKTTYLQNETLRQNALNRNMSATPKNYNALLKLLDTQSNPITPQKIALGKELFFERLLSFDNTISCASCHKLKEGGEDNLPTAIGYLHQRNPSSLNTPTVLNASLAKGQFWNGRVKTLEAQAKGPIEAPFEMNLKAKEVEKRLNYSPKYQKFFTEVFATKHISFDEVADAIAVYEKTLLTRSAYDDFLEGNNSAISPKAQRGMSLFISAGCSGCHGGIALGGQSIQKFPLRHYLSNYIGLKSIYEFKESPFPFPNSGGFLGQNNLLRFRVPILKNITKTSPYFHNGAVKELKEAIRIMSKYQIGREFTPKEIEEVEAFFETLEGRVVVY